MPTHSNSSQGIYEQPGHDVVDSSGAQIAEEAAEVAGAVAEVEAALVAREGVAAATERRVRPFEVVMLVLLAISLLVHALTIARLLSVRNTLRSEVEQLAATVQRLKSDKVR